MAAKPPHTSLYVVDCPPSSSSRPDANHGQAATPAPQEQKISCGQKLCLFCLCLLVFAGALAMPIAVAVSDALTPTHPKGDPVFSVAVAGVVAGLDPARDVSPAAGGGPSLSPVFNLTFHINNTRNREYDACVPGLSTVAVSYGDAFLGKGSVPPFCAEEKRESEPVAGRAWGDAVEVPRFLRDQMAGELAAVEATVDVKVTMPSYCTNSWCNDAVLSCKAKIGGGASPPCRLDYVIRHGHDDD